MDDKFSEYLKDENQPNRKKALTAKSYKNKEHFLRDQDTNSELATYGDALLKYAYCRIFFEEDVENISEKKKGYETDEILVTVIAKHYNLLDYVLYDDSDDKIPKDYDYRIPKKRGRIFK